MQKVERSFFWLAIIFAFTSIIHFALALDSVSLFDLYFALSINIIFDFLMIIFCFASGFRNCIGYFCFVCTFSILILGQYFFAFFDSSIFGRFSFGVTSAISFQNELKSLYIIFLSQLFVFLGYFIFQKSRKCDETIHAKENGCKILNIRFFSKLIMVVGFVPAIFKLFLTISFVLKNGYLSLYLENSNLYLNPFLDLFDGFYVVGVFCYLATYPSKKETILTILVFMLYNFLSIFTGSRGQFVVNTLFVFWYLIKTNVLNLSKKSKKFIIIIGVPIVIIGVSFLYTFGLSRVGSDSVETGIFGKLFRFVRSQGGSGRLIGLSIEYSGYISKYMSNLQTVIWPIRNFVLNNSVMRIFTGGSLGQSQNNLIGFGDVLTYVTNRDAYLDGGSVGTCYIAELFCSGGSLLVIVGNALIGLFLSKIDSIERYTWGKSVMLYVVFTNIVYISRQAYLKVLPELIIYVFIIIFINLITGVNNGKKVQDINS